MDTVASQGEYHEGMIAMLQLIWGEGFMAPGGAALVRETVEGLELDGRILLDIGSGLGGGDLVLAERGAKVIGVDIDPALVERARRLIAEKGQVGPIEFRLVEPGPLDFPDASVDIVYCSGAFTQIADKRSMFREVRRVLKPGGWLAAYDWMKGPGPISADMRYFFQMEGLTYAMETPEAHGRLLTELGFEAVHVAEDGGWYRDEAREELKQMKRKLKARMTKLLGKEQAAHFVENWRAMTVVLDNGELRPGRYRARKPIEG
jgi:ubiquinone/menaquinone biosynthesis C-methylase UbiE